VQISIICLSFILRKFLLLNADILVQYVWVRVSRWSVEYGENQGGSFHLMLYFYVGW